MENFVGSQVYFKCPKRSWIVGELCSFDPKKGGTCKAGAENGGDIVKGVMEDCVHPCRDGSETEDVDDLLMLTELHDSTLLTCIKRRFMSDIIYTNIGAIVVAVNPFNFKIPRYQDNQMKEYLKEGPMITKCLPHSWASAHNTYFELRNQKQNQSILVSGESGAGKTEASKIVMKYLASVSCIQGSEEDKTAADAVGQRILASSPILEAFGNAKTVRNDNSSRFGKFMEIKFNDDGLMVGAHITKYLLEKSRIVTAAQGERIYHSFYLLLRSKNRAKYFLEDDKKYKSACSGKVLNNVEYDTEKEFNEVCDALGTVGVSEDNINSIWKVVAGILHLENVECIPEGEGCMVSASAVDHITKGTKLWGIDAAVYEQELKENSLVIMGNVVKKLNKAPQAMDARSALNKALYDAVFTWIVKQCNEKLDSSEFANWIGLLDIFGFENFTLNSFEQLCINLTNETLQNHYNSYIFCKDLDECRAEGVDVSGVPFDDNSACMKLISGQGSIMSLLDEECQLGSGTDDAFFQKVTSKFARNPFFEVAKTSRSKFTVKHYAADVSYEVANFREKNLDTLKDAWKTLLRSSTDSFISNLLPEPVETKGPKPTVGGYFRKQLQQLMDIINSTNPHWIRCIKPHPAKKPLMFDGVSVLTQLSSSGVLGTVKVRKAGYPVRLPIPQFVQSFQIIAKVNGAPLTAPGIIKACNYSRQEAQVGKKRVFLKSHIFLDIETKKKQALSDSAKTIQGFALSFMGHKAAVACFGNANRTLIAKIRANARALLDVQMSQKSDRDRIKEKQTEAWLNLVSLANSEIKDIRDQEEMRQARIRQAMMDIHIGQQEAIVEEEMSYRDHFFTQLEMTTSQIQRKFAEGYNFAQDLQARREHNQAEKILMRERRELRDSRRQHELRHILEKGAKRLDPTLTREDKLMRSTQLQEKAMKEEVLEMEQRAKREIERQALVQRRFEAQKKQESEKRQERMGRRVHNEHRILKSEVAFERYQRVMGEDFEWQKMERRLILGQQLSMEEQRKKFLREKSEMEKLKRMERKEELKKLMDQKKSEIVEHARISEKEKSDRQKLRKKEEDKIFNSLQRFREEVRLRERAKKVERSIAWDNDRRERMILQRPDVPSSVIDSAPLAVRVPAPEPFVMAGNKPTFGKTWNPFRLLQLDVAPRMGVAMGTPFTVTWMGTKTPPAGFVVICTGAGEVDRHRVRNSIGQYTFTSPKEWFSELEIRFVISDGSVAGTVTLPRVAE